MYRCEVCRKASKPKAAKLVYKGVALCGDCHRTVLQFEREEPRGVAPMGLSSLIARELIASYELQQG